MDDVALRRDGDTGSPHPVDPAAQTEVRPPAPRLSRDHDVWRLFASLHQAMVEGAEDGVLVADETGGIRYANAAAVDLLGVPVEDLLGTDPLELLQLSPEDADPARPLTGAWRREVAYVHPDGTSRTFEVRRSHLGGEGSWLVVVTDVTERRSSERTLRRRALHDPLTGLPNRYLLRDRLETAAARQRRAGAGATAVLFVDLDRFKAVNDTLGHGAGDELLRQVAARLSGAVRGSDTVGRLGGDEFLVICEEIDDAGAASVAGRVHAALWHPFELEQGSVEVDASVGVALSPPHDPDDLVHRADLAMYAAKRRGGNRSVMG